MTKPDTKQVDVSKSTISSMKNSKVKSIVNSAKNRKFIENSINSGDSSWNSDNQTLNSMKRRRFEKMSTEKKLENIFKIYNRKDMITKLNSLRKNNQDGNLRTSHFKSTEIGEDCYKDNDYISSTYLTKLENNHHKMNASMYSTRQKARAMFSEMPEVEASLEATPNNSIKFIGPMPEDQLSAKKLRSSINNFKGAYNRHNSEAKKQTVSKKSAQAFKYKKMNTIVQEFVPLKQHQMTASEVENANNRYSSVDKEHD